ncbi:hypothetical protein A2U01_0029799, partial [Trifolium medium]|nr:hypothetical protein [Trifolium medium]
RCFSSRDFMEKRPPMVADVEKVVILDMRPAARQEELARDAASMIRLLDTALVLNDEKRSSTRELEKLKVRNEKLEAEVLKLEGEAIDLRGKQENYIAQLQEIREMKAVLEKAEKDLGDLKTSHDEENKKSEEELGNLKSAMAPADGEPESVRGLTTRAQLVERIQHSWENALAQIKIVNPGLEFSTEGMGMLRKVVDGQIIIPEQYRQIEADDV